MLAVLSPAKRLDFETPTTTAKATTPAFEVDSAELIDVLRAKAPQQIASLMGISDDLAELNSRRYASWQPPSTAPEAAKQAVLAFKGDVYLGLEAWQFDARELNWAQKHLRILSGLHGVLRPLDTILPYRLEMGTQLATKRGSNLYEFWGDKVTNAMRQALDDLNTNTLDQPGVQRVLQRVVDADALERARDQRAVQGTQKRAVQVPFVLREESPRPDGRLHGHKPCPHDEGAKGIRLGRLRVQRGAKQRRRLGVPSRRAQ